MYVTNRRCVGAGPFEGPLVVSMRPFAPERHPPRHRESRRASQPCMADRSMSATPPRSASPTSTRPTSAIRSGRHRTRCRSSGRAASRRRRSRSRRRPSLAIFHAPGHMFITDRPHARLRLRGGAAMTIHDDARLGAASPTHRLSEERCAARRSATPSNGSTSRSTASWPPTSPTSSSRPATTPPRCSTLSRSSRRRSSCARSAASSSGRWPTGSGGSGCSRW